jgi:hypothetical protein
VALRQGNDRRPSDVPHVPQPRREDDALARHRPGTPAYRHVLETAYRLGWADGGFASAFDEEAPDGTAAVCRGRTAAEFAEYLWADQPGPVPAAVEVNAPLWYLAGLNDALATT